VFWIEVLGITVVTTASLEITIATAKAATVKPVRMRRGPAASENNRVPIIVSFLFEFKSGRLAWAISNIVQRSL
jgi:hypothetical protein